MLKKHKRGRKPATTKLKPSESRRVPTLRVIWEAVPDPEALQKALKMILRLPPYGTKQLGQFDPLSNKPRSGEQQQLPL